MIRINRVAHRYVLVWGALVGCAVAAPLVAAQEDKFPNTPIEVVIHSRYGGGTEHIGLAAFKNGYKVKVSTTRGYWVLKGTP